MLSILDINFIQNYGKSNKKNFDFIYSKSKLIHCNWY